MALERELKLSAPPGFRLPPFEEIGLRAVPDGDKRMVTTYFDTPDLRLARWNVTLRYRAGEGWTVKLPGTGSGAVVAREEVEFGGPATKPPPAALALLRGLLRRDEPVSVARLRTIRRVARVEDETGRACAEIDDDEVSVIDGRRLAARFRQLEVELTQGASDRLLEGMAEVLQRAGAAPDPVPKAVRALGPHAEAPPEAHAAPVGPHDSAGTVVAAAFAASTARLLRNDPGVRLGDDPEAVHQARVATRRLRADLRTFRDLVEPDWAASLRDELRWLGGALGAVRDTEVMRDLLTGFVRRLPREDQAAARRLAGRVDAGRTQARQELLRDLASVRYLDLLEALLEAARGPRLTEAAEGEAAEVLPRLVERAWKRLRRDVRSLPEDPADEQLHEVRILAKRLRYAAEAVGLALSGYERLAKEATALQDVLGRHQDAVTAQAWLRAERPRLTPPQAFAAGELWGLAGGEAAATRREWPAVWKSLRDRARATL